MNKIIVFHSELVAMHIIVGASFVYDFFICL